MISLSRLSEVHGLLVSLGFPSLVSSLSRVPDVHNLVVSFTSECAFLSSEVQHLLLSSGLHLQ